MGQLLRGFASWSGRLWESRSLWTPLGLVVLAPSRAAPPLPTLSYSAALPRKAWPSQGLAAPTPHALDSGSPCSPYWPGGSRAPGPAGDRAGFSESCARCRPVCLSGPQLRLRGLLRCSRAKGPALAPLGPQPRSPRPSARCPSLRDSTADHCQLSSSRGDGDQAALTC